MKVFKKNCLKFLLNCANSKLINLLIFLYLKFPYIFLMIRIFQYICCESMVHH